MRARLSFAAVLLTGTAGIVPHAHAQAPARTVPTHVIYSFGAQYRQGKENGPPSSDLASDNAGNLYGVTELGGISRGYGTVYRLVAPAAPGAGWTEQTLYDSFNYGGSTGYYPGYYPTGKPVVDSAGNIYGMALGGGLVGGQPGNGTIWKLSPPATPGGVWTFTVLYTFSPRPQGKNGGPDGGFPTSGLIMDRSGTLYGTTNYGGTNDLGVVFSLTPPAPGGLSWTETVLYNFTTATDGIERTAPLVLSNHQSALSGTTPTGSTATVFQLRRRGGAWVYHQLAALNCSVESGLLADRSGNLFGTTSQCNTPAEHFGIVYELSPPATGQTAWTEQVLHAFTGKDGAYSLAGLAGGGSGALFGTTPLGGGGGAADGSRGPYGVVFRLDPPASGSGPWSYTVLHAFDGPPRGKGLGYIRSGLTFKRLLYGVSTRGGSYKSGAVFVLSPRIPASPPAGAAP